MLYNRKFNFYFLIPMSKIGKKIHILITNDYNQWLWPELTRVTVPFYVPFPYFLFILYLSLCTLPDFPSVSSLTSLPYLSCCHWTGESKKSLRISKLIPWIMSGNFPLMNTSKGSKGNWLIIFMELFAILRESYGWIRL